MALDTYANLQSSVLAWLNRTGDTDATTRVIDWITLAEDEMRLALSRIKVRQGETSNASYTISSEYQALPTNFIGIRSIRINSDSETLDFVPPQVADRWDNTVGVNGKPKLYTIQGNQIRFMPVPDASYTGTITYYTLPALSVSNTTNWLLTAHPKIYLRATLAEAYDYYRDDAKKAEAENDRERLISAMYVSDGADQQGGSMRMRIPSGTP